MSVAKPSGSSQSYRPDIDGMRAIAILSVVLCHAGAPWITGGFTGVDIFFVISGYLIGGHIFSEVRESKFSFLRFYQRRAKRILPALYVVLAFVLLAAMVLLSPSETVKAMQSAIAAILSAANIAFWKTTVYFAPASGMHPLIMTWSLGVEEQFYLVIPLLMVILARIRRKWILPAILTVCALSFMLACYELGSAPKNVFYLLPERAWELGVGVGLAVAEFPARRFRLSPPLTQLTSLVGLGLVLAPMFLIDSNTPFPGATALPSVLGTAMIIAVPTSWINRRLLSLSPLVFVGKVSYSFYLWHWPLLTFLRISAGDMPPKLDAYLSITTAFAAAVLSYYFIEQPCRRSTSAPIPLLIRYAFVSVLFLGVCSAVLLAKGLPQRFPLLGRMEQASTLQTINDPCLVIDAELPTSPGCYNKSDPGPAVAIWGDSHSAALAQGMRSVANSQGYGFVELGRTSCVALTGAANFRPSIPLDARQCIQFNRRTLDLLESDPRVKIVVLTGAWENSFKQGDVDRWLITDIANEKHMLPPEEVSAVFQRSLTATIQGLQQSGKQVIVLEDVPTFDLDPLYRIRAAQIPARHALAKWMGVQSASDPGYAPIGDLASIEITDAHLKMALEGLHGVQLIDLKHELCLNENNCAYRKGDMVLYSDPQHLATDGARYVLRNFHFSALSASGE